MWRQTHNMSPAWQHGKSGIGNHRSSISSTFEGRFLAKRAASSLIQRNGRYQRWGWEISRYRKCEMGISGRVSSDTLWFWVWLHCSVSSSSGLAFIGVTLVHNSIWQTQRKFTSFQPQTSLVFNWHQTRKLLQLSKTMSKTSAKEISISMMKQDILLKGLLPVVPLKQRYQREFWEKLISIFFHFSASLMVQFFKIQLKEHKLMRLIGLQFLDKTSLGYSSVFGIIADNKLVGQDYSWAS